MTDIAVNWPGSSGGATPAPVNEAAAVRSPIVRRQHDVEPLRAFGDEISVLLSGADTGGRFMLFLDVTPPGSGPPPHYHLDEDEWFVPLEGQVEFFLDGAWQEVPPHALVYIPRGAVHTFRNSGDTPLKMLTHCAPGGFETFFARCAAEFAKPGPPNMPRIIQISAEHGIHYITE